MAVFGYIKTSEAVSSHLVLLWSWSFCSNVICSILDKVFEGALAACVMLLSNGIRYSVQRIEMLYEKILPAHVLYCQSELALFDVDECYFRHGHVDPMRFLFGCRRWAHERERVQIEPLTLDKE